MVVRALEAGSVMLSRSLLILAAAALACSGCTSAYHMDAPPSFRAYEQSSEPKWITSDGVMLKVRSVENYPKASLDFWVEAMREHLVRQGYASTSTHCFKTKRQLPGCRLDFLLPHGNEDWVLSETLFVLDDDVHLVEAAGPYSRFAKVDKDLQQALGTFQVGGR
jgi:hypothetical protein